MLFCFPRDVLDEILPTLEGLYDNALCYRTVPCIRAPVKVKVILP